MNDALRHRRQAHQRLQRLHFDFSGHITLSVGKVDNITRSVETLVQTPTHSAAHFSNRQSFRYKNSETGENAEFLKCLTCLNCIRITQSPV